MSVSDRVLIAPAMTVGIVVFGLVFLSPGSRIGRINPPPSGRRLRRGRRVLRAARDPVERAGIFFASFALIVLSGLVVDSVRETVGLLLGR